jgi:hypothetical protein
LDFPEIKFQSLSFIREQPWEKRVDTSTPIRAHWDNEPMKQFLILLTMYAALPAVAQDRYSAEFNDSLTSVSVRACFDGEPPARLYHHARAATYSSEVQAPGGTIELTPNWDFIRLEDLAAGDCLAWQVDFEPALEQRNARHAMRSGQDLVMDGDLWFWRGPAGRQIVLEVTLPESTEISAPWQLLAQDRNTRQFVPADTPATWTSRIAVGHFEIRDIPVDGTRLRLAMTGSLSETEQDKLEQWIKGAATAVGQVFGQYPQSAPQVLLVPIGPRDGAVPWAHVLRGGGVGAEFFVDQTRSLEELSRDWTACHELSHMLLPFISRKDRWLSEGVASYYQYVLLARSGQATEQQAWQGLIEGFRRGMDDSGSVTLAQATQAGWDYTMRVYWSGAAMMLMADTRLRARTDGRHSLDSALAGLAECCRSTDRSWRASELFKQLDRITGTRVFSELLDDHVGSQQFPDLSQTLEELGIDSQVEPVRLYRYGPLADVRRAIMSLAP